MHVQYEQHGITRSTLAEQFSKIKQQNYYIYIKNIKKALLLFTKSAGAVVAKLNFFCLPNQLNCSAT